MKVKLSNVIKNFSYSLTSNLTSVIISSLVVLILPRIIGVEEYGYWQLYLFYSSYLGFFHFGWVDGIYLRYGGDKYEKLDKNLFFSQFHSLAFFQFILSIIVLIVSFILVSDEDRLFIFHMISIELIIINLRTMLTFILQATNRIKEYSKITISSRIVYLAFILFFLFFEITNYKLLILSDLVGKTISLLYAIYVCKDIVIRKVSEFTFNLQEIMRNISAGIKLTFSYVADMLVTGIVRFGIENNWSVGVFGQVSLTLSISSMFTLFINALGLVIYPILRRINEESLSRVYQVLRNLLMILTFGILLFYMPINIILSRWLPHYADSLNYMALLFPIIIFQSKKSLLIDTYMKALRLENIMLQINIVTVILSLILTFVSTILLNNLDLSILSIVILMAFRDFISEIYLSGVLKFNTLKNLLSEYILVLIFMYTSWIINSWLSPLLYGFFYFMYIYTKRVKIWEIKDYILQSIKNES